MNKNDIKIEEVNSNQVKENYKLKLVVVGDSGVGKTNLIKRFVSDGKLLPDMRNNNFIFPVHLISPVCQ